MTKLKPVLIISYFFPPIGMAGGARAYGLFRHLVDYGYRPYVVTVRDIIYPAYDSSLLTADDEQYIVRTESLDPSRLLWRLGRRAAPTPSLSGHLSKWITPDYKKLWVKFATNAAKKIIAAENIELVMTTSPTPSAHLVGQRLQSELSVKWLADYRDMWVSKPIEDAYLLQSQKRKAHELLCAFRRDANHVTAVNRSIAKYVEADTVITNAVDPSTCELWDNLRESDSIFRFGYLGTTDSAETIGMFTKALASVLKERKISADSVRVRFVGAVDEAMLQRVFAGAGLSQALEIHGYLPRAAAISALADVDALLVTIPENLPFVTPSKVFDALVSGKPLIAIAPSGSELANLVISSGERSFSSDDDALSAHVSDLINKKSQTGACRESAEQKSLAHARREKHSWSNMAQDFANVFDGLLLDE